MGTIYFQNQATVEKLELQRQKGKYAECINDGMLVPQYSVMYGKIWNLIEQCSQGLLEQGQKSFQDKYDLNEATRLLNLIPKNSSFKEKSDEKVRYWTDEYYYRRMLKALEKCNWEAVIRERGELTTDSWIEEAKLRIQEAKNPDGSLYCPDSSIPPVLIPELKLGF